MGVVVVAALFIGFLISLNHFSVKIEDVGSNCRKVTVTRAFIMPYFDATLCGDGKIDLPNGLKV